MASIGAILECSRPACDGQNVNEYFIEDIRNEIIRWPLSIEFSEDVGDKKVWLFGVHLTIFDETGIVLFDAVIEAPVFVANIPPGNYRLFGSHGGVGRSEIFEIVEGTALNITMHWD